MIANITEDKPWDEQVAQMQSARAEFYQEISLLTNGRINNPQEMAEATGEELSLWQGWRSPRPNELKRIGKKDIGLDPGPDAEFKSKSYLFFQNVPDVKKISDKDGMLPGKEEWRSVREITHEQVGGQDKKLKAELMQLRETLILERMTDEDVDYNKAEVWVEENRIGIYKRHNAGPATIFASPEAVERLSPPNLKNVPTAPEGWKSSLMIGRENKIRNSDLVGPIAELREKYVEEQIEKGMGPYEADKWVEENRIGTYKPHRGMGTITLYASPEATARLLKERGVTPLKPSPEGEDVSGEAASQDKGKKV